MANIAQELMIKFGLPGHPTEQQIKQWVEVTQSLINQGHSAEIAGSSAAKVIFPGCGTHIYASQSDTILTLLARIRGK